MTYDFASCFEKLSGFAHKVGSLEAAAEKISEICRSQKVSCIALANLPDDLVAGIENHCPEVKILKEPYASETLPLAIDEAQIGVTGMEFGIAQSGTMVEVSTNDAVRLVSSLPRTHIGVIHQRDILDTYFASSSRIREILLNHDANVVVSFISGPSRTGDIELKLTLGVHGPEEAHAVIIEDS